MCARTHMTYTYIDTHTETYTLYTQRQRHRHRYKHRDMEMYVHTCTTFIHTAHSDLVRPYNWCLENTPQMILTCKQALKTLDCCLLHCPPD